MAIKKEKVKTISINYDVFKWLMEGQHKKVEVTPEQFNEIRIKEGKGMLSITGQHNDHFAYYTYTTPTGKATTNFILNYHCLYCIINKYYRTISLEKARQHFENHFDDCFKTINYIVLSYCEGDGKQTIGFKELEVLRGPRVCFPNEAVKVITEEISKHYSEDQVNEIIRSHQYSEFAPSHDSRIIQNYKTINKIQKFEGCHYYDINKAYNSRLVKAFPKIKPYILNLIKKGKADPDYKAYSKDLPNYAIGCFQTPRNGKENKYSKYWPTLSKEELAGFRFWVVEDIDKQVKKLQYDLNCETLYLNTDGLIVYNAAKLYKGSQELGDFKEETIDNNIVWTYHFIDNTDTYNNYTIMQWFEDGKKVIKCIGGFIVNCDELVEATDLSKGIVPLFKTKTVEGHKIVTEIIKKEVNNND